MVTPLNVDLKFGSCCNNCHDCVLTTERVDLGKSDIYKVSCLHHDICEKWYERYREVGRKLEVQNENNV